MKNVIILSLLFLSLFFKAEIHAQKRVEPSYNENPSITLGDNYLNTGNYEKALASYLTAKSEFERLKNNAKLAQCLEKLAIVYWKTGNKSTANDLLLQSEEIFKSLGLSKDIAHNLNNRGLIWSDENPGESIVLYQQAISIYDSLGAEFMMNKVLTQNNLAIAQSNLHEYYEAIEAFEQVREYWVQIYGVNSDKVAFVDANLGDSYYSLLDYTMAETYFRQSIQTYHKAYGEHHPELATVYNHLSNLYLSKKAFKEALEYNEKAKVSNTFLSGNASFDRLLEIAILEEKAEILIQKYRSKTLAVKDLKQALAVLDTCSSLLLEHRQMLLNKKDKIAIGRLSTEINEMAIECILILRQEFFADQKMYNQKLFDYIEKSKGASLLDAVQDAQAKQFGGVPDLLIEQEKQLLTTINDLENQIQLQSNANLGNLRAELSNKKGEYTIFVSQLEKDYPAYYQLKYAVQDNSIEKIQDALSENDLIINYFISTRNEQIIALKISKSKVYVEQNVYNANTEKWILGFLNGIKFSKPAIFHLSATKLCETLSLTHLPKGTQHLIIIPHKQLSTLPFEAILTQKEKEVKDFKTFSYLINDYNISYHFSTNLWIEGKHYEQTNLATIFAPVYFKSNQLPDLKGSENEALQLDSVFKANKYHSSSFVDAQATEAIFNLHAVKQGDILHIPTHGLVDSERPDLSRIYLRKDPENDGILYSGEIYSLSLPYNLITLSACETGLGKITEGEGVIGLSRAMLFSGAQNIIVSFWSVDDLSTAQLMIDFYKNNLEKKQSYSTALQSAKKSLIASGNYSSPYYWAPFILIGK